MKVHYLYKNANVKTGQAGEKNHLTIHKQNLASHMWPELGSNHSGEKPNGLRVNFPIH